MPNCRMFIIPLIILASAVVGNGEEPPTSKFPFPVMIPRDADQPHRDTAEKLRELLASPFPEVMEQLRHPGCAFWVERDLFANLGAEGYLIRIAPGGATFLFTDDENAKRGLAHLESVLSKQGTLPVGILTNHPVIPRHDGEKREP